MSSLLGLPLEILSSVISELPNCDIKNFRLACKRLWDLAPLRLDRVFLSPHHRDIEVFEAIAADETFRHRVVEIVYDDTRFHHHDYKPWEEHDLQEDDYFGAYEEMEGYDPPPKGVPRWYFEEYKGAVERGSQYGYIHDDEKRLPRPDLDELSERLESGFRVRKSYRLYQRVVEEQDKGIQSEADRAALELGLKRFPNLRRVCVTPAAHGIPLIPVYETPLIRSFDRSFVYPPPIGWPRSDLERSTPVAGTWNNEEEKSKWRGLCLVLHTLASHPNKVTEFIVDVNKLYTGFNAHMFYEPNAEYASFVTILKQPGFSHLDLALFTNGGDYNGWPWYRSNLIKRALAEAKDLRHVNFYGNVNSNALCLRDDGAEEHSIPLRNIFPVEQWTDLIHFGLWGFLLTVDDLCSFLSALPGTLRSVNLSFLNFINERDGYPRLLEYMRRDLGWRERPVSERPRIEMHVEQYQGARDGDSIDVSAPVESFVYGDGTNPFGEPGTKNRGDRVYEHQEIGIQRNSFFPANDLLFAYEDGLMARGLIEKSEEYQDSEPLIRSRPKKN